QTNSAPRMLSTVRGRHAPRPPRVAYLRPHSGRSPRRYRSYHDAVIAASRRALDAALGDLRKEYGPDQSRWLGQSEVMHYEPLGAGFVPDMPFENKGTF